MNTLKIVFAAALAATSGQVLAQAKEVRIAHVYDKTGPLEAYAKQTHAGLMMGLEYATGGKMEVLGRRIVVIEKDSQTKPDAGKAQLAAAFADDKVDLAIGPTSSGVALAMLPVAEEYKKIRWSSRRSPMRSRESAGIATSSAPAAPPRRTRSPTRSRSARKARPSPPWRRTTPSAATA